MAFSSEILSSMLEWDSHLTFYFDLRMEWNTHRSKIGMELLFQNSMAVLRVHKSDHKIFLYKEHRTHGGGTPPPPGSIYAYARTDSVLFLILQRV